MSYKYRNQENSWDDSSSYYVPEELRKVDFKVNIDEELAKKLAGKLLYKPTLEFQILGGDLIAQTTYPMGSKGWVCIPLGFYSFSVETEVSNIESLRQSDAKEVLVNQAAFLFRRLSDGNKPCEWQD